MKSNIISSFSNTTRLKLLICLGKNDKNVTDLIKNCGLSQSAVSQHLEKLKSAGLVTCSRKGKEMIYTLRNKKVSNIAKELLSLERMVKKNES